MKHPVREVTQTILVNDTSGRPGNCLQAAVASLLDLPLADVPHFLESADWEESLISFLLWRGWVLTYRPAHGPPPRFGLALGVSPRGVPHAVACREGTVWDPHPSRDGLTTTSRYIQLEHT